MPVGTEVGSHPATSIFGPCLWLHGWMDQDVTWYGGIGLGPGDTVLDGDPASPNKGHSTPTFRPMSSVAKRQDGSRCHLVSR